MEQELNEENTQNVIDFKSKGSTCDVKKSSASSLASDRSEGIVESQDSVDNFASPTPEKTIQPSRSKNKQTALFVRLVKQLSKEFQNEDGAIEDDRVELPDDITDYEVKISDGTTEDENVEIPDKYKTLAELFDRIITSVRLLSLRKKLLTFQNICTVVKVLINRNLSYSHLAQIKYVLPEAIQIEKILIHDEKTLCMIPDMKITLLLDIIEPHSNQSTYMELCQVFNQRLLDFFNSHPKSCGIPEAILPEPFCQRNHTVVPRPLSLESSINSHTASIDCEPLLVSSSFSQSFKRHFSQKTTIPETEKTQLLASSVPPCSVDFADETDPYIRIPLQRECTSVCKSASIRSPAAPIFSPQCSNSSASESPPMKLTSLPHPLIVETPAQTTPEKRLLPSSDDKMNTDVRILSHVAAKKSLNFSLLEGDGSASSSMGDKSEQYTDSRFQAAVKKSILGEDDISASASALTHMVEENNMMKKASSVKCEQMRSSLTDLFNTIQSIFQSAKGRFITKQELLQKIIANTLDIVEIREVEEQLELLEELAPDWICRKLVSSGDLFYSIRRVSDLEYIRARLSEVV